MAVESLASHLLQYIVQQGGRVSRHNSILEVRAGSGDGEFARAVAEAWDWLLHHGLIVDPAEHEGVVRSESPWAEGRRRP